MRFGCVDSYDNCDLDFPKQSQPFPQIQKVEITKDSSFDRRKQTNQLESTPLPFDDFIRPTKPSETPIGMNYYCGKFDESAKLLVCLL